MNEKIYWILTNPFFYLFIVLLVIKIFLKFRKKEELNISEEKESKLPSWLVPLLGPVVTIFGLNEFFKITNDIKPENNFREEEQRRICINCKRYIKEQWECNYCNKPICSECSWFRENNREDNLDIFWEVCSKECAIKKTEEELRKLKNVELDNINLEKGDFDI